MFVCVRGFHYYVSVCLVLAVSEVSGIVEVILAAYYVSIVVWGE